MPTDTRRKAAWMWKGRITRLGPNHFVVYASVFETPAASSIRYPLVSKSLSPDTESSTWSHWWGKIPDSVQKARDKVLTSCAPSDRQPKQPAVWVYLSHIVSYFYPIRICIKKSVVFSFLDPSVTLGETWSWEQDLKEWSAVATLVELCSRVSLQILQGDLIRKFNWNENIHLGSLPVSELVGRARKWPIQASQTVSVSECALELGLKSRTDTCLLCAPPGKSFTFSVPQFPHLYSREGTYHLGFLEDQVSWTHKAPRM